MIVARKRLTRKLIALFVAPILLTFVSFGAITSQVWRAALLEDAARALTDHAASLRAALAPRSAEGPASMQEIVARISATEVVHGVALYDQGGRPIARSALLAGAGGPLEELVRRTIETRAPHQGIERIGGRDELVRIEAASLSPALGAVVVSQAIDPLERLIRGALLRLAAFGGTLALVMTALAIWVSRVLGAGLGSLVSATERVAGGELAAPPIQGSRLFALDRVAGAFNEMTAALERARAELDASEATRRELERRILHAQALTVVGQVASSVAHEIGSPLNTILGWARLSASDEVLPEQTRRQFETIATQCERITRIVQRMLKVARPPESQREAVALPSVAREIAAFLAPDLRARSIALHLDLDARVPPVLAARDQLLQLVLNLCMNAVQVQPRGGALRVSLAEAPEEASEPRVSLEVADGGPGIGIEQRALVFEPFYSTKRAEGGTGLGLAVVADIVRDLGGRVSVGDAPEGGALFRVVLPGAGALGGGAPEHRP